MPVRRTGAYRHKKALVYTVVKTCVQLMLLLTCISWACRLQSHYNCIFCWNSDWFYQKSKINFDALFLSSASVIIVGYIYGWTPQKLIQKVSQRNLLLFFMPFNILQVLFILTIRKGSFSRWRPRWLPRANILYIQGNI